MPRKIASISVGISATRNTPEKNKVTNPPTELFLQRQYVTRKTVPPILKMVKVMLI